MIKSLADISRTISGKMSNVKMTVVVRRDHVLKDTLRSMQRAVFSPDKDLKVTVRISHQCRVSHLCTIIRVHWIDDCLYADHISGRSWRRLGRSQERVLEAT